MYLAYNTAAVEKLGKPAVMMASRAFVDDAKTGGSARDIPGLRVVPTSFADMSHFQIEVMDEIIPSAVNKAIDNIVDALTIPLTEEEQFPTKKVEEPPRIVFKGNLDAVNIFLYRSGWAYGMPVIPPTEEKVKEMLCGTDLKPDYVVAKIPPMLGKATVEKIAVNAVMAGALPTYMPVLIAAVQAMTDPKIKISGYSCSVASWAPLWIINGPIRHDLHINSGHALMSPYYRANAAIGHALGLITMNIGGVRPGLEDMASIGHEGRFGMCIAENEEESPWEPLHVQYGLNKDDSAISGFWPNTRFMHMGLKGAKNLLGGICKNIRPIGFDPGSVLIMNPGSAKSIADEGWTKKEVISYIAEYARKPAADQDLRWLREHFHQPKEKIPLDPKSSMRLFFSDAHLFIVVAGGTIESHQVSSYTGGDYGGPITKKVMLPSNWDELVIKYKDIVPTYTKY